MQLVIMFDNGDCEVVAENIEDYDFTMEFDRDIIINGIQQTINKVKAFQAASPEPNPE